jgi:uncharacterized protein YycO
MVIKRRYNMSDDSQPSKVEQLQAQVDSCKKHFADIVKQYTNDFTDYQLEHDLLIPREGTVLQIAKRAIEMIEMKDPCVKRTRF